MNRQLLRFIGFVTVLCWSSWAAAQSTEGDAAAGEATYKQRCATCHSLNPEQRRVGPHLLGVVGRKAGSVNGFDYSSAMTSSDLVWSLDKLDAYVENPRKFLPGTKMIIGLTNKKQRSDVIAFLETQVAENEE